MNVLLFLIEHEQTLAAMGLTFLVGAIWGMWLEFSQDNKKGQQRGHAESQK